LAKRVVIHAGFWEFKLCPERQGFFMEIVYRYLSGEENG